MEKEEIIEILKESHVLKVAKLEHFSTNSDIFVYFKDMGVDSKVFETKLIQLKDKFILRGFCNKTDFSYEYAKHDNLVIEAVNIKKFYDNIEILSVTRNNEIDLSINITDNKDNNAVISLGKKSLSFSLNENDYSMKLRVDFGINEIIRYQERNKNQTFNLKLTKENKKIKLSSYNTVDNKILDTKIEYILSKKSLHDIVYDFVYNEHIRYMIDYIMINILMEKLPVTSYHEMENYEIFRKLYINDYNKPLLETIYGNNGMLSNLINERKVLNFEQNKQKKLRI